MKLNGKEVRIVAPPTNTSRSTNYVEERGYVYLHHGDIYAISLSNRTSENNDASVKIDGKEIGTWRIAANSSGTIERPAEDRGCFTFYEIDSIEALQTDLVSVPKEDLGLVQVTFVPEKIEVPCRSGLPAIENYSGSKGLRGGRGQSIDPRIKRERGAGGTGLSGRSSQEFGFARPMELDPDRAVTVSLRLVAAKPSEPRALRAVGGPIANSVPPPVS